MTHGDGHARVPTTRFPLTASPNLWGTRIIRGSKLWLSPNRTSLQQNPAPRGRSATEGHRLAGTGPETGPVPAADGPHSLRGMSKGQRSQVAGVCPHP